MKGNLKLIGMAAAAASLMLMAGTAFAQEEETTFRIALDSDIVALDPIYAYDFTTNTVVNQITQPLLMFDFENQLQPNLAYEWEAVDETTYVYQIRDDVCFSDGTPMTMDDVLFSIERNMDPDVGSYLNWMMSNVESVEQTGDWELTVHLAEPSATWQYVLATTAGHVVSKAYYEEHELDFGTAEGGLMGTGPYIYESWSSGQEVVLTKNENYWDKEQELAIDRLVYKVIPEDTTRVAAAVNGELDFVVSTPSDMLDTLSQAEDLEIQDIATAGVTFLAFNTERAPFDDVNVRKAITAAVDLQAIQDNIVKEAGQMGTFMPNSSVLFTIEEDKWNEYVAGADAVSYDLDKAAGYLSQSAYPDGFECNMIISENSLRYNIALYLQQALAEIGITVNLVQVSGDEHTNYQFGGIWDDEGFRDYDMIMAGWEADYPDVTGNIEPLLGSISAGEGGANSAAYRNEDVDALINKAMVSSDPAERTDALIEAMNIVNEDCPYVFLFYPNKQVVIRKDFTGFTMNSSWIWNLCFKDIVPA